MHTMAIILLVEDNQGIVLTLSQLLAADGHAVTACQDTRSAVEFVQGDQSLDVALVDYWLVDETAEPVLAALRSSRPGTPVVLITGGSHSATVETTRWLGAVEGIDGFLQKPFLRRDLQEALQRLGL